MYAVKPYYEHDRDVELPTVMYKMKNIHREAKNGPVCILQIWHVCVQSCGWGKLDAHIFFQRHRTMFWLLEDCTLPSPITSVILKPFIVYSTIICKCYQTGQTRIRCWIISDRRIKTGKNFAGWITCICETHAKWKHAGSVWFKKFALKEKDIVQYAEVSLRGGSR